MERSHFWYPVKGGYTCVFCFTFTDNKKNKIKGCNRYRELQNEMTRLSDKLSDLSKKFSYRGYIK